MQVHLDIVDVHLDPQARQRIKNGNYRINAELNQEWIDLQNNGPYVLNLQGRVLAAFKQAGVCQRHALLYSTAPIALHPSEKMRIFTGEQPRHATYIDDQDGIKRVLWLAHTSYIWGSETHEACLYVSMDAFKKRQEPLSRFICI